MFERSWFIIEKMVLHINDVLESLFEYLYDLGINVKQNMFLSAAVEIKNFRIVA